MQIARPIFGPGSVVSRYYSYSVHMFIAFVPLILMIFMSLKSTVAIYGDFWGFPWPPQLGNYTRALIDFWLPAARTILLAVGSIAAIQVFATVAAYGFARIRSFCKEALFYMVIVLMMIPAVLVLTPNSILATRLGLRDSLFGLGVFYVSGGQVFAISPCRFRFRYSLPWESWSS